MPESNYDKSRWLTSGGAAAEFKAEVKAIPDPLPSGDSYPPGLPSSFKTAGNALFEKGLGKAQAWHTWLCAWEDVYLADSSSDKARLDAQRMIEKWPSTSYFHQYVDDPTGAWRQMVIVPMDLGDPSGVQANHDQLCSHYPYVHASTPKH